MILINKSEFNLIDTQFLRDSVNWYTVILKIVCISRVQQSKIVVNVRYFFLFCLKSALAYIIQ